MFIKYWPFAVSATVQFMALSLSHTHALACFIHNDYELIYPHAMPVINPLSIDSAK